MMRTPLSVLPQRACKAMLTVAAAAAAAMLFAPVSAEPALAADGTPTASRQVVIVSETPANELPTMAIDSLKNAWSYQFAAFVPPGGSLEPVDSAPSNEPFANEVIVKNAQGELVGGYDAPYARDANNDLVPTTYRIVGANLVQTVKVDATTAFPVAVYLSDFEPAGRAINEPSFTIMHHFVKIPSNYVYNTKLHPKERHDYCTTSPDWFRPLGARNTDFRGPCAIHDLCYDRPGRHKKECDDAFYQNLLHMCDNNYGRFNPIRLSCRVVAKEYHIGVKAGGHDDD